MYLVKVELIAGPLKQADAPLPVLIREAGRLETLREALDRGRELFRHPLTVSVWIEPDETWH